MEWSIAANMALVGAVAGAVALVVAKLLDGWFQRPRVQAEVRLSDAQIEDTESRIEHRLRESMTSELERLQSAVSLLDQAVQARDTRIKALEETVQKLTQQVTWWRGRVRQLERYLREHGMEPPPELGEPH